MSKITMEILTGNYEELSDVKELIDSSGNGSLFQRPRFLSYHDPEKFQPPIFRWRSYLFLKGNTPVAFLPGMMINQENETIVYKSPFGSSYGGLVYKGLSFQQLELCIENWWNDLIKNGVDVVEIVPIPSVYCEGGNTEGFEFELYRRGFRIQDPELVLIAQLCNEDNFPLNLFSYAARKNFNKSMNYGVTVECPEDFQAALDLFYPILVENRKRFNTTPTHSYAEILKLKKIFPENIHLLLGRLGDQILCGSLIFCVTPTVINTFYIADTSEARQYRAGNALIAGIYNWALDRGVKWVDLGPSSFGLEPNSTLIQFKESLGGRMYLRRRYLGIVNGGKTKA